MKGLTLKEMTGTKYNLSYYLIFPMMPGELMHYKKKYLQQVFCIHEGSYGIGLLYNKHPDDEQFNELLDAFEKFRSFKYSRETNTQIFVWFSLPDVYREDFDFILDGKYSKISDLLKDRIKSFHNFRRTSSIFGILHKAPKRKRYLEKRIGMKIPEEVELFEEFNIDKNTYE